jgi:hypothetical protein
MCSCEYFPPVDYRCPATEKDELSYGVAIPAQHFFESTTSARNKSKRNSVDVSRENSYRRHTLIKFPVQNFLTLARSSDFGVGVACSFNIIFFLTSLFIDSIHQSVATNDRCISSP